MHFLILGYYVFVVMGFVPVVMHTFSFRLRSTVAFLRLPYFSFLYGGSVSVCLEDGNRIGQPLNFAVWSGMQNRQICRFSYLTTMSSRKKVCLF